MHCLRRVDTNLHWPENDRGGRSLYGAKAAQTCHDAFAARGFIG